MTNLATVTERTMTVADVARKAWDAGLIENINGWDAQDYSDHVATHSIITLLWADTEHDCPEAVDT